MIDTLTNTPATSKDIQETDPYTCCTYCITDPACGAGTLAVGFGQAICTLYYPTTCDGTLGIGNYANTNLYLAYTGYIQLEPWAITHCLNYLCVVIQGSEPVRGQISRMIDWRFWRDGHKIW